MSTASGRPSCALPDTPIEGVIPGIMTCVHCGFCLQACPTYLALEDENDSPRGRILIMRSLVEGDLSLDDPSVHTHIDRCLGCQACETACPSGVPYGQMLEATRATLRQVKRIPVLGRIILWMFARPAVLRPALAMARVARAAKIAALLSHLSGRIGDAMAMLAASTPALRVRPYVRRGQGTRGTAALLLGCVMDGLFRHTHRATERTLAANDYRILAAPGQRCCGALHAHAGDLDVARALARRNIDAFERSGADHIAVNAAGCGAMMKSYGHLLADDPEWAERASNIAARVRDVSELLSAAGPTAGSPLPHRVTYDAPCHLLHAQRLSLPPLRVLAAIPGLDLVPLADADQCCGAAGIYNILEPGLSRLVLAPKLANIAITGAGLLVTGNPGCHMQIGGGLLRAGGSTRAVHPVELLDASYAGHWT